MLDAIVDFVALDCNDLIKQLCDLIGFNVSGSQLVAIIPNGYKFSCFN